MRSGARRGQGGVRRCSAEPYRSPPADLLDGGPTGYEEQVLGSAPRHSHGRRSMLDDALAAIEAVLRKLDKLEFLVTSG